jgi:hypothetical protein
MLASILMMAISIALWKVLLGITIVTLFIAIYLENKETASYIQIPVWIPIWLFWNLVMWLIYFIIN